VQRSDLPKLAIVAIVYYVAVRLGLETVLPAQFWAAAGIGLAAILRWGPAMLVATVPAHFVAHLAEGSLLSFAAAAYGALQAVEAATQAGSWSWRPDVPRSS